MNKNNGLQEVYITHTAAFLPNHPVGNDEMENVLGRVGDLPSRTRQRILRSNGIHTRYYAIDPDTRQATHSCADLAAQAVQQLFAQGVSSQDLDVLACATSYPDQTMPGHGAMVHGLLSADGIACEMVSTAGVCTAGMTALKHAYNAIRTGEHQSAIACAAEAASAVMRKEAFTSETASKLAADFRPELAFEKDFLRWMLSDGAGAVHLSNRPSGNSLRIVWLDLVSYAHEQPVCMYAGGDVAADGTFRGWKTFSPDERETQSAMAVKQNVKLLNENIVHYTLEKALSRSIQKHGLRLDDVDFFLPHYSSHYFRDKMAQGLANIGFPISEDKWFTNLASKGNTGSASIYIMLDEFLRQHTLQSGQKILCYVPESGRFSSAFMLLEKV
ncbi:MAG: beta-ketoacyl-ACP synthase III [Neisseria sp.]|nr:beta-ketoacyl-ACP synthase III [Neisseria sp.]